VIAIPYNIVVVDLETSGLDPLRHGILEIGAHRLADGNEFSCAVRLADAMEYDPGVFRINGITEAEARSEDRMSEAAALSEFFLWLGEGHRDTIAGSNPKFDHDFLKVVAGKEGFGKWPFGRHLFDLQTAAVTYLIATGTEVPNSLSADSIYRALGLPEEPKPHKALRGAQHEAHAFRVIFGRLSMVQTYASILDGQKEGAQ